MTSMKEIVIESQQFLNMNAAKSLKDGIVSTAQSYKELRTTLYYVSLVVTCARIRPFSVTFPRQPKP